jgi:DNA damage-binding protein 1
VSCVPQDAGRNFSTLVTVAFWGSNHIEIFSIERTEPRLKLVCKTDPLSHVPRSLLLCNFVRRPDVADSRTHLLASLGNGTVVSFAFRNSNLSDQKTVHLGGAPVCIKALPYEVDGRLAVFASGSVASIFSYDKNRLRNTPIVFKVSAIISPISELESLYITLGYSSRFTA